MTRQPIPARYLKIVEDVAKEHRVPVRWIFARDAKRDASGPRQAAYARIRSVPMPNGRPPPYQTIGRWFGGRNHATVLHGIRAHEARTAKLLKKGSA